MARIDGMIKLATEGVETVGRFARKYTKPTNLDSLHMAPVVTDCIQIRKPVQMEEVVQISKPRVTFSFGKKQRLQGAQPEITKYDTGIKDNRLAMLKVEKRINCDSSNANYPIDYTFMDEFGQIRLKPHLYLDGIEVKKEFARQGICCNTEKEIIELSRKEGFGGRVILLADKMDKAETKIVRSSLAHWKSGFRFCDEQSNRIMERVQRGELPKEAAPLGFMYYPI